MLTAHPQPGCRRPCSSRLALSHQVREREGVLVLADAPHWQLTADKHRMCSRQSAHQLSLGCRVTVFTVRFVAAAHFVPASSAASLPDFLTVTCQTSGNSLDYTDKDMEIMTHHKAVVKEMEAAAIAWVAQLFHKPMFCVKAVTDIVDGDRPTQDEFLENLHTAAAALQQVLPKVLEFVAGKTLRDL